MATKTVSGTYSAGYALSASYSTLSITGSGYIGGSGLLVGSAATVVNYGAIMASAGAGANGIGRLRAMV